MISYEKREPSEGLFWRPLRKGERRDCSVVGRRGRRGERVLGGCGDGMGLRGAGGDRLSVCRRWLTGGDGGKRGCRVDWVWVGGGSLRGDLELDDGVALGGGGRFPAGGRGASAGVLGRRMGLLVRPSRGRLRRLRLACRVLVSTLAVTGRSAGLRGGRAGNDPRVWGARIGDRVVAHLRTAAHP